MNKLFCLSLFGVLLILISPTSALAEGRLAIIIDDIGYNLKQGQEAAKIPIPLTLAVLPFTPHGVELAELAHQQNKEIMLHTPMSNERHLKLGPGALQTGISQDDLIRIMNENLHNIPYVKGVNNHMGSQLTQDKKMMNWLMADLKDRQLYFIDSRTTAKTEALNQAELMGIPSSRRDVFLDDTNEPKYIHQQLNLAIQLAKKKGQAIAIGHPYRNTLDQLHLAAEIAKENGVKLVLVSDLLRPRVEPPVMQEYQPGTCAAERPSKISFQFVTNPFHNLPSRLHKN